MGKKKMQQNKRSNKRKSSASTKENMLMIKARN
jgi:hypothetical protein